MIPIGVVRLDAFVRTHHLARAHPRRTAPPEKESIYMRSQLGRLDSLGRVNVLKVGAGVQPRELNPDIVALVPVVALSGLELRLLGTVSTAKKRAG